MNRQRQGYILGLGSNISPQENMAAMILALIDRFNQITLSRVLEIPPVNMDSQRDFLNAVAFIETGATEAALKNQTNQIEIALGRDRDDPQSKTKDRPADIDILYPLKLPDGAQLSAATITDEYFLYPVIEELFCYLMESPSPDIQSGVSVDIPPLRFGKSASTIYRDAGTGDIRILE